MKYNIKVNDVRKQPLFLTGEIVHQFDVTVGSSVGHVTFHKGRYSHGYDLYLTSTQYPQIYAVSLENGKVDIIKGELV